MTLIAASGTIIASAALFIVLSGFAGLKEFSLRFSAFVDPDLKVVPATGKSFVLSETEKERLQNLNGVASFSKIIEERAILQSGDKRQIITLKGVDANFNKVTAIDSMVIFGRWLKNGTPQIVSGGGIANMLSMGVLDMSKNLSLSVPKPGKGQITSVKSAFNSTNVVNIGIFDINQDLNYDVIYADINLARSLLNYSEDQITGLELRLQADANEGTVKNNLPLPPLRYFS